MALKRCNAICVDIGSKSIKIIKTKNDGSVEKSATVGTPIGAINSSGISSKEAIIDAIRLAKSKAHIGNGRCVLCISNFQTVVRKVDMPALQDDQIYQNVLGEFSSYLPEALDNYVVDYKVINKFEAANSVGMYNVMGVALNRQIVKDYMECLKAAGLKVETVDIPENAMEKLIEYLFEKKTLSTKNCGVIDFGYTKTVISAYSQGLFFITKAAKIGLSDLIADLVIKETTDPSSIETQLKSVDFFTGEENDKTIENTVQAHVNTMVSEAVRVFDYYRLRNSDNPLGAVIITGGYSNAPGFKEYLSKALNLPVFLAYSLLDDNKKNKASNEENDYAVLFGASLRKEHD